MRHFLLKCLQPHQTWVEPKFLKSFFVAMLNLRLLLLMMIKIMLMILMMIKARLSRNSQSVSLSQCKAEMTRRNSGFAFSRSCQHLRAVCPIDRFPFHDRSISWIWLNLQGCTMCTAFQSPKFQNRMSIPELHFESSFQGYPYLPAFADASGVWFRHLQLNFDVPEAFCHLI